MALQNRVMPDGKIVASPARGTFMGNRGGRIHDPASKTLSNRRWASKRWICCLTDFKNRQRTVMGEGYTELFFLDEVTALASGHRPCFECRRKEAERFAALWAREIGLKPGSRADQMDDRLHGERLRPEGQRPQVLSGELAEGCLYQVGSTFITKRENRILEWTMTGYEEVNSMPDTEIQLLTPTSIAAVLAGGYEPDWHHSASN